MEFALIHRDDHLAAFAKPSGLLVHRGWGDDAVTALDLARDALGAHVYPVHRLDRGTSGVLLFALDPAAAAALGRAFEQGEVEKVYLALVRGVPPIEGVVDHAIPRREDGPRVPAVTAYRRLAAADPAACDHAPARALRASALVLCRPRTGRLHQVRRHMKHLSHPIIGDANYGKGAINRAFRDAIGLDRLALHAASIRLLHPITGASLHIVAEVPESLAAPLRLLGIPASTWEESARQTG